EKPLVCGRASWVKARRVLVEPQRFVGYAVRADDHGRRHVCWLEKGARLRDHLAITGEYDRLGRIWRDVHGDLPATIVVERLSDVFARDRVGARPFRRYLGEVVQMSPWWRHVADHSAALRASGLTP